MKKVCGIVAEYNPFHNGHRYHLDATRAQLGEDCAMVCVMSGNFVQRGAPAVLEKHARAEAALRCGADLVIELPLPWALSSAEGFARGAVSLLRAAGVVNYLSFGSESGTLAPLRESAAVLLLPELDELVREELRRGDSYAAARQRAAERLAGSALPVLNRPNDMLGVEYLKAIAVLKAPIQPLTVLRRGAGHDEAGRGGFSSASDLRQRMETGTALAEAVPPEALEVYVRESEQGRGPADRNMLETALLSRLRNASAAVFAALPDAGEGLENRLRRAARTAPTLAALLEEAAAKRYTLSRLRRMLWGAALGLRREDVLGRLPPYLRVLGANAAGRGLLAEMRKTAQAPILTRPAAVHGLDSNARRVFALEAAATDLWSLGAPDCASRRGDAEWKRGPVML